MLVVLISELLKYVMLDLAIRNIYRRIFWHFLMIKELKETRRDQHTFLLLFLFLLLHLVSSSTKQSEDDPRLGVDTDSRDENLAAALHHVGAGQHHRVHRAALLNLSI